MEMRVKQGRGYVSADRNFDSDLEIGYIPIDSVHSPVRNLAGQLHHLVAGRADVDRHIARLAPPVDNVSYNFV